jgi:hypothetical protein
MSRNKRENDLVQLFDNQRFAPFIVHRSSFIIHHYLLPDNFGNLFEATNPLGFARL